jgi:hypothetical protein
VVAPACIVVSVKVAHEQLAIAVAILAVAAGTAGAASSGSFAGRTGQKVKLSFQAGTSTITRLHTVLDVDCVTAYPSFKSAIEIVAVSQRGAAVLRGGHFSLTLPAPIAHPTKKEVTTVTGAIHGHSANGMLKSFYLKNWDVYNPTTGMYELAVASCAGKTTWTAKR